MEQHWLSPTRLHVCNKLYVLYCLYVYFLLRWEGKYQTRAVYSCKNFQEKIPAFVLLYFVIVLISSDIFFHIIMYCTLYCILKKVDFVYYWNCLTFCNKAWQKHECISEKYTWKIFDRKLMIHCLKENWWWLAEI